MLRESATFNFGYSYSLNMTILSVCFIYSGSSILIVLACLIYFFVRLIVDCHLLLNVFKNKLESDGTFLHTTLKNIL